MPRSPDRRPTRCGCTSAVAALIAAGYGLTLAIFYPGIMTYDAKFVYEDIAKGVLGDWQSPVMTVLWRAIDPIAPGAASMFLLDRDLLLARFWRCWRLRWRAREPGLRCCCRCWRCRRRRFVFVGIIWRDVLFATSWLLAAAMVFAATERGARVRMPMQVLALVLCAHSACCCVRMR